MRYDYIFFDLDGTLTDPGLGITNSVMYALEKLGAHIPPRERLYSFIGPPLIDSFMAECGFSREKAELALTLYREYFRPTGIYENEVYPGIPELLAELKGRAAKLGVATSKPEIFAYQVLEHFGLREYFDFVSGSTMDEKTRITKADVLEYGLQNLGVTDRGRAVMVGDRKHDIEGARSCGITSCAVLYGYGSREEFEEYGADIIVPDIGALRDILLTTEEKND